MAAPPSTTRSCPHCNKPLEADLLAPNTERAGYKCPHCRLFVPIDRLADSPRASAA
ncbi:MAG TPA: hypothetical protein VFO03_04075 [Gaiellaceae bacterium]|nr:hypothetical protein [Gaiellaceae bacterium]